MIRPENLRLGARDGNAVSGRVSEIVYAGSETRVIAALEDGSQLVLRLGPDDAVPAIDETIVAGWPRDKAVLVA
ncbi:TOBE domain protein [compost metagenome]